MSYLTARPIVIFQAYVIWSWSKEMAGESAEIEQVASVKN